MICTRCSRAIINRCEKYFRTKKGPHHQHCPRKSMKKLIHPEVRITDKEWQECECFQPNCGPTALAVIAQIPLLRACSVIPGFAERHYTNPTMMAAALKTLGIEWHERDDAGCDGHTLTKYGLCRIQWEGPWTAPGSNPKWAYRHSHWIAAAEFEFPEPGKPLLFVFDINCGWQTGIDWMVIHSPEIIAAVCSKGATGNWWATHRWEFD